MGKTAGSSWLAMIKKAFRSTASRPTEDRTTKKKDGVLQPKREPKRWRFKKIRSDEKFEEDVFCVDQMRAIALAATAAEAAAGTTKAAVEIVRLTHSSPSPRRTREAAILIQTAFRGFLARSALRAFKGIVKLQALVRGQNVRRQAKTTLRCMQALIRVQERFRRERGRLSLSNDGSWKLAPVKMSTFGSMRETHSMFNNSEWDDIPRKKEASKAVARALSNKILCSTKQMENVEDEQSQWVTRWMATRQWEWERRDASIKTVEVDGGPPTRNRRTFSYVPGTPERWKEKIRSPRVVTEEKCPSASQTPSMGSRWGSEDERFVVKMVDESAMPGYMAATESARAKSRPVSAGRQRPPTPEKDSSARKRLHYPDSGSAYSPCSTVDSRYFSQPLFR